MLPPENLLLVLIGCLLLPWLMLFITAPIRMKSRSWQKANPRYTSDDESHLPPIARIIAADLRTFGLEDRGTWRHDGAALATGWVILLEHPRTLDVAKVLVVTTRKRRSISLVFQTRFEDGTEVVTANTRVTAGFPPLPGMTVAWLPAIRDADSLYRVHEQLRDALGGTRTPVGVGSDPAGFLQEGSARALANWVATGYYELDLARGVVRPTWKGAVLVTWRLIWPVKPVFRFRRRRATSRLLRQLGINVGG